MSEPVPGAEHVVIPRDPRVAALILEGCDTWWGSLSEKERIALWLRYGEPPSTRSK